MRTVLAGVLFAAVYGVALRWYRYLRVRRPSERWHLGAVARAALLGGAGFYAAQQVRVPHVPGWWDLAAFAIMAVAAASIPVLLEIASVVAARAARRGSLEVPAPAPDRKHEPDADR
jgi:drug/metabolite transporter (DMT)-like permease